MLRLKADVKNEQLGRRDTAQLGSKSSQVAHREAFKSAPPVMTYRIEVGENTWLLSQ
jgi:hypothetical protein